MKRRRQETKKATVPPRNGTGCCMQGWVTYSADQQQHRTLVNAALYTANRWQPLTVYYRCPTPADTSAPNRTLNNADNTSDPVTCDPTKCIYSSVKASCCARHADSVIPGVLTGCGVFFGRFRIAP